jgi:hypothetical protein
VLGVVQASSLRSDRAFGAAAGLTTPPAQLTVGNYVMATNYGAEVDDEFVRR